MLLTIHSISLPTKYRSAGVLSLLIILFTRIQLETVSAFSNSKMAQPLLPTTTTSSLGSITARYHIPPPDADYSDNLSVFGKILRGELPAKILDDSSPTLLAFEDIHRRAPFHALVIPKRFVESVYDLDLDLLQEMRDAALKLLQKYQPEALAANDFQLCFHIPPFNSVDHVHLHVLSPLSELSSYGRLKYWVGARWCISEKHVRDRLEAGDSPVPYKRMARSSMVLQITAYTMVVMGGLTFWILQ